LNARRATLITLLLAVVLSSRWLTDRDVVNEPPPPLMDAGYYVLDATLRGVSDDGEALFEISADRIQQQPALARVALEGVTVTWADSDALPWRMTARAGTIGADWRQLELRGDVRISRVEDAVAPLTLNTDNLTVLLEAQRATTRSEVLIAGNNGALIANGMTADLLEQRFVLESAVRGRFVADAEPREQAPMP
jgi:LPS export ABC transporter protein LptC